MARRFREIMAGFDSDLGGDLTEARTHIAARAACLICWSEEREAELARGESFDAMQYATVANAMRRLLSDLGLDRQARDVSDLHDYLARKAEADG